MTKDACACCLVGRNGDYVPLSPQLEGQSFVALRKLLIGVRTTRGQLRPDSRADTGIRPNIIAPYRPQ
ncbi:hypothetical protein ACVWYQ_003319 [Bradyrhizobium sp. USDA 3397]